MTHGALQVQHTYKLYIQSRVKTSKRPIYKMRSSQADVMFIEIKVIYLKLSRAIRN